MFDRSFLPPSLFEFVVLADTHYMPQSPRKDAEFSSRLKQTDRAGVALELAASLAPNFTIHMGDLVQEYPETKGFDTAIHGAIEQLRRCGVVPRQVAGNHDVGDKPDPTMPTRPVTPATLGSYHKRFGPSWYSFDCQGCHFIVLNSQILNTQLPEREQQREWLEQDLEAHRDERKFVFLHLPPYLFDSLEAALGHYDNIAEPDRGWLLGLVRRYHVEWMVAAHVHCSFYDRIATTRYLVCNSPSFTRPGFCHLFTSAPPPDQGRDDTGKLGFYLFRVFAGHTEAHFLRTAGALSLSDNTGAKQRRLITRTPASLEKSALGVTMVHPLSEVKQIPLAWPSAVRQRIRNDYPLTTCLELGAKYVRVPLDDVNDSFQRDRLEILRSEGVQVIATVMWSEVVDLPSLVVKHSASVDGFELQLPGAVALSAGQLNALAGLRDTDTRIHLSTIVPGEVIYGKQHPRTRHGFRIDELAELDAQLSLAGSHVDRVLCRMDDSPWGTAHELALQLSLPAGDIRGENVSREASLRQMELSQRAREQGGALSCIGAVDFLLNLSSVDDPGNVTRAAEALFATALLPESRLFVEPLIDLDRTMDVTHGLLDALCNPRPVFHALRCLNTILAAAREDAAENDGSVGPVLVEDPCAARILDIHTRRLVLVSPVESEARSPWVSCLKLFAENRDVRMIQLAAGVVCDVSSPEEMAAAGVDCGPVLLVGEKAIDG